MTLLVILGLLMAFPAGAAAKKPPAPPGPPGGDNGPMAGTECVDAAGPLRESVRALVSRAHLGAVPLDELLALVSEVDGELESERAAGAGDQETQE